MPVLAPALLLQPLLPRRVLVLERLRVLVQPQRAPPQVLVPRQLRRSLPFPGHVMLAPLRSRQQIRDALVQTLYRVAGARSETRRCLATELYLLSSLWFLTQILQYLVLVTPSRS